MKSNPPLKLIIGLGNSGKEYEKTYHNAGFLMIDYLIKNLPISNFYPPTGGPIPKLLKTNVFMNQSGSFVAKISKKYHIKPDEILIIHDDSDIELGNYKLSFGRGSAGHNGVESIMKTLKTKNFWRLRIGIRPPICVNSNQIRIGPLKKAGDFVLKKISKKDLEILEKLFEKIPNEFQTKKS